MDIDTSWYLHIDDEPFDQAYGRILSLAGGRAETDTDIGSYVVDGDRLIIRLSPSSALMFVLGGDPNKLSGCLYQGCGGPLPSNYTPGADSDDVLCDPAMLIRVEPASADVIQLDLCTSR